MTCAVVQPLAGSAGKVRPKGRTARRAVAGGPRFLRWGVVRCARAEAGSFGRSCQRGLSTTRGCAWLACSGCRACACKVSHTPLNVGAGRRPLRFTRPAGRPPSEAHKHKAADPARLCVVSARRSARPATVNSGLPISAASHRKRQDHASKPYQPTNLCSNVVRWKATGASGVAREDRETLQREAPTTRPLPRARLARVPHRS